MKKIENCYIRIKNKISNKKGDSVSLHVHFHKARVYSKKGR